MVYYWAWGFQRGIQAIPSCSSYGHWTMRQWQVVRLLCVFTLSFLVFFPVVCQCYLVINPYTIYVYNMYIICYIYLYDLILLCLKIPLESSWLHHLASSGLPAMPTWKVQEQLGDLSILGSRRTTNLDRMWWDMYTCDVVCIYIYILN